MITNCFPGKVCIYTSRVKKKKKNWNMLIHVSSKVQVKPAGTCQHFNTVNREQYLMTSLYSKSVHWGNKVAVRCSSTLLPPDVCTWIWNLGQKCRNASATNFWGMRFTAGQHFPSFLKFCSDCSSSFPDRERKYLINICSLIKQRFRHGTDAHV